VSWLLQHWIGYFHAGARTALLVAAHYLFPQHRFIVIPLLIVAVYIVTIAVFEQRWRRMGTS
jgi:hypothetical protein